MPVYDYHCGSDCGPFSELRTITGRDLPAVCPDCGGAASRRIQAPQLALMPASLRTAHATNERASHEPRRSRAHGAGCGCCAGPPKAADASKPKGFAGRRPWMISH